MLQFQDSSYLNKMELNFRDSLWVVSCLLISAFDFADTLSKCFCTQAQLSLNTLVNLILAENTTTRSVMTV